MTPDADRRKLLQFARDVIAAHVGGREVPSIEETEATTRRSGVFVSLHKHGDLRGCIGHIEADQPLAQSVARCAISAATSDPRFPAVTAAELAALEIELSILGPLEPVSSVDDIEIGRHGLLVEMGWHRGLLLPQVATEWKWDRETFIAQTCHKAGLALDAWKKGATLWRFEAEVFGEQPDQVPR
jgi:AmmeMemoRadiSam system protein A